MHDVILIPILGRHVEMIEGEIPTHSPKGMSRISHKAKANPSVIRPLECWYDGASTEAHDGKVDGYIGPIDHLHNDVIGLRISSIGLATTRVIEKNFK